MCSMVEGVVSHGPRRGWGNFFTVGGCSILKAFAEEHAASVYVRYFVGGICRKSQQRVAVVVGQEKLQGRMWTARCTWPLSFCPLCVDSAEILLHTPRAGVLDTLHTVHSTHVCSVSPCKPASDYDLYNPNGEKALQSIVQNLPDAVASFQEFACAVVRCGPPLNTTPVSPLTSTPLSLPPLFHQVAAP